MHKLIYQGGDNRVFRAAVDDMSRKPKHQIICLKLYVSLFFSQDLRTSLILNINKGKHQDGRRFSEAISSRSSMCA
jgi:hypothetical protein